MDKELEYILEALRSGIRELETLEEEEDWFISTASERMRKAEHKLLTMLDRATSPPE